MENGANGKWQICIDFTYLNKASPKDLYPFPKIDSLVNETLGYKLLSFFIRYHQIILYPPNKEKITFIIEKGTYCIKL